MTPQSISIISTLANLGLGISKLIFGFLIGSVALMADGIHSGLDVISSFVTFLGWKVARKPVDETHPYGYWKAENLAGFGVTILLAISAIWILYEGVRRFFGEELVRLSTWAIVVVIISIVVAEFLARLKFHYGKKYRSLSLVADAEHSRADVLSSVGVLMGLFLVRYFNLADAIVAIGIGGYILLEAFRIGKEVTDSLLDVSNKEVEQKIKKICEAHNIEIADLKTRKIGVFNSAELKIKLPPKLKVEEVQKITDILEERLLKNIPELQQIAISIEAYHMARTVVLPKFGRKIGELEGFEKIGPKKLGERIIIPLENETTISPRFGAAQYLVIDKKNGEILTKEIVKNPYLEEDRAHGARFAKAVRADKVLTQRIGPNAKRNLDNFGIEVEIISPNKNIKELLEGL
jgi:cation diffusion facilitator family transporter